MSATDDEYAQSFAHPPTPDGPTYGDPHDDRRVFEGLPVELWPDWARKTERPAPQTDS